MKRSNSFTSDPTRKFKFDSRREFVTNPRVSKEPSYPPPSFMEDPQWCINCGWCRHAATVLNQCRWIRTEGWLQSETLFDEAAFNRSSTDKGDTEGVTAADNGANAVEQEDTSSTDKSPLPFDLSSYDVSDSDAEV